MTVRRWHLFHVLVVAAFFYAGWATAEAKARSLLVRVDDEAGGAGVSADGPTCVDRSAMDANANLVEQVGDLRRRFERAREDALAATLAVEASRAASPSHVVPTREEWARMGRDGTIRMRLPCTAWDGTGTYSVSSATGEEHDGAAPGGGLRTRVAGLSDAELEAVSEAYARALSKTWAAMRDACEANAAYRASLAELESRDTPPPAVRMALCTSAALDMQDDGARRAVAYVAQLRAAGVGIDRATSDEQRVGFALSNASATLYEEVAHALGRERATRALDNGVGCFDETVFDVHDPPAESVVEPVAEESID